MAHFAQINDANIVLQVLVTNNDYPNEGYDWLIENLGGRWVQTSYNARIRKNFAGIGFYYDEVRDAFIAPKPFESWTLDEETCQWQSPKPYPNDNKLYEWDETALNWKEIAA